MNTQWKEIGYNLRSEGYTFSEMISELDITSEELEIYEKIRALKYGIMKGNKDYGLKGGY